MTTQCLFCGCNARLADDSRPVMNQQGSTLGKTTPQRFWVECADYRCAARGPQRFSPEEALRDYAAREVAA